MTDAHERYFEDLEQKKKNRHFWQAPNEMDGNR